MVHPVYNKNDWRISCENVADCLDIVTLDSFMYLLSHTYGDMGNIIPSSYNVTLTFYM